MRYCEQVRYEMNWSTSIEVLGDLKIMSVYTSYVPEVWVSQTLSFRGVLQTFIIRNTNVLLIKGDKSVLLKKTLLYH